MQLTDLWEELDARSKDFFLFAAVWLLRPSRLRRVIPVDIQSLGFTCEYTRYFEKKVNDLGTA
jgi:hypothetical protein